MADIVDTNRFKNGMHIEHKGSVWRIVEFQHVKPGKGGAFVRTKLKNLDSGAVVDETFRAGEKFARVHTEVRNVQFLYDDGTDAHFMDEETFEQFGLPRASVEDELAYMLPSSTVQILQVNGTAVGAADALLGRARGRRDRARRQGRHGLERDEARDPRDRRRRPGAALRERGRPRSRSTRAKRATSAGRSATARRRVLSGKSTLAQSSGMSLRPTERAEVGAIGAVRRSLVGTRSILLRSGPDRCEVVVSALLCQVAKIGSVGVHRVDLEVPVSPA